MRPHSPGSKSLTYKHGVVAGSNANLSPNFSRPKPLGSQLKSAATFAGCLYSGMDPNSQTICFCYCSPQNPRCFRSSGNNPSRCWLYMLWLSMLLAFQLSSIAYPVIRWLYGCLCKWNAMENEGSVWCNETSQNNFNNSHRQCASSGIPTQYTLWQPEPTALLTYSHGENCCPYQKRKFCDG
jgi:hypothetical protein